MIVLLVILGLAGVATCPGIEFFQETTRDIDYQALIDAGAIRPNVFNCANMIGNSPEESYKFADPKTDV